ncbi:MAG TPA: DUF5990 family protein [Pyrinomonadaceae bacterium]|nr:DUF5990 family protein [Pyrinomonadaceae bacterium]
MKREIPLRIIVTEPLGGVTLRVQKGRDELVPPTLESKTETVFDFIVNVELNDGLPNFLGKFAQGPKDSRFIYVNSGQYSGQSDSGWARRAKVSLMNITADRIEEVLASSNSRLETSFAGVGSDGGPTCASIRPTPRWTIGKIK